MLGEATALLEPCEGALDDPAARQDAKMPGIGAPHVLDGKAVEMRDGGFQLWPGVSAIGEKTVQRGICVPPSLDEIGCAVTALDVGGMNEGVEQVTARVVCGCPRFCKAIFQRSAGSALISLVCQACSRGSLFATGRYAVRRTRSTSVQRATMLAPRDWFPRPEH